MTLDWGIFQQCLSAFGDLLRRNSHDSISCSHSRLQFRLGSRPIWSFMMYPRAPGIALSFCSCSTGLLQPSGHFSCHWGSLTTSHPVTSRSVSLFSFLSVCPTDLLPYQVALASPVIPVFWKERNFKIKVSFACVLNPSFHSIHIFWSLLYTKHSARLWKHKDLWAVAQPIRCC